MRNEDMYHYSFDIDAMERELQQIKDNEQWQHYSTSQRSSAS